MHNEDEDEKRSPEESTTEESISDIDDDTKTPQDSPKSHDEHGKPLLRAAFTSNDPKTKPEDEVGSLASSKPAINTPSQKPKLEENMMFLSNLGLRNSRIKDNRGEIIVFNKLHVLDINNLSKHVAGLNAQQNLLKKINAEQDKNKREQLINEYANVMGLSDMKDKYKLHAFIHSELATLDQRPNSNWKLQEDKKDKTHAIITCGTLSIDIRHMVNEKFGAMVISSTATTPEDFHLDMVNGIKLLQENAANIEYVVVHGSNPEDLVITCNLLDAAGMKYELSPEAKKAVEENEIAKSNRKNSDFLNKHELSLAAQTVAGIDLHKDPDVQKILKEYLMDPLKKDAEWTKWQRENGIAISPEKLTPSQSPVPENALASSTPTKSPASRLLELFKNPSATIRAGAFAEAVFPDDTKKSERLQKAITGYPARFANIAEMEYRTQHGSEPDIAPRNNPKPM